jgi:hypothetical protein
MLYANTMKFYTEDWTTCRFGYWQGFLKPVLHGYQLYIVEWLNLDFPLMIEEETSVITK